MAGVGRPDRAGAGGAERRDNRRRPRSSRGLLPANVGRVDQAAASAVFQTDHSGHDHAHDYGEADSRRRRWTSPGGWASQPALEGSLTLLVAGLFVVSLVVGAVALSPGEIISGLIGGGSDPTAIIVREFRLPRALLGVLIGGTLGLAGAALQGLLRTPLAAPSLFGAPAAAAFGAVLALTIGVAGALSSVVAIAAIAGAALSVGLLVIIAGPRTSHLVLILAGLAVSTLAAAGTALLLNIGPDTYASLEISYWLLGSLEDRSMQQVFIALPFMVASWVLLAWDRGAFRALILGEEAAESLGIRLASVRIRVVLGVALGVGASVAVAGSIGLVGLVAPFLVRPFVRHDPARLLLPAALAGAALLLASDILVRLIPTTTEIKVGVITALIGAPVLILMVLRRQGGDLTGSPL